MNDVKHHCIWKTQVPIVQEGVQLHNLIHAVVAHDIPMTYLHYLRLVLNSDYTSHNLLLLFPDVPMVRFREVFVQVLRPEWVHQFWPEDLCDRAPAKSNTPD